MKHKANRSVFATRLGLTFALIAAMTAVLAGVITYVAWSLAFESYIRSNLQSTATYVARHAGSAYYLFNGWDFNHRTMIPQVSPRQDVIVQIFDNNNNLVYDESVFNPQIRDEASELFDATGIRELNPEDNNVIIAPVVVDYIRVGEVRVYAYGSAGLLTAHDLEMRTTSLLALGAAGFFAIIVSTIIGMWYSRRLVSPISQITVAAQRMRDGDESARSQLDGDDEIAQLGITFDMMADSIQRDRERERRMTGDVAHELRTPLMGIQATVEAIEDGIYPADSEHLSIILRETKRLTGLTNSLLELSRLEDEKTEFPMSVIDFNDPVNSSVSVNRASIEALGLTLIVNLKTGMKVNANASRMQQAVTNLLTNSMRYTPEGGTVTVTTFQKDNYACVAVKDTGMGMSSLELQHVFARFWRADSARDRATGGIGIGLPITKEIVERHGGKIEVESKVERGTTFTIMIPLAK
ncbi:MAG: ATP-binding protein [Coriobacteriia bacterium]|nr:ATP-binding protein [Coriobacteriia bacterium]MCL2537740.1 ATP-binding protein [Coriobacteriia bacterium]